jgi:hypothetical protein
VQAEASFFDSREGLQLGQCKEHVVTFMQWVQVYGFFIFVRPGIYSHRAMMPKLWRL